MAHQTWNLPAGAAPAACVNYVTLPALNAAISSSSLTVGCWYVVTGLVQGTLGPITVAVLATDVDAVSADCHVGTMWDVGRWWDGTFDPSAGALRTVRDNDGNFVDGATTIASFPWGYGWINVYAQDSLFSVAPGVIADGCRFIRTRLIDDGATDNSVFLLDSTFEVSVVSIARSVPGTHVVTSTKVQDSLLLTSGCENVWFSYNDLRNAFVVIVNSPNVYVSGSLFDTSNVNISSADGTVVGNAEIRDSFFNVNNCNLSAFTQIELAHSVFIVIHTLPDASSLFQQVFMANSAAFAVTGGRVEWVEVEEVNAQYALLYPQYCSHRRTTFIDSAITLVDVDYMFGYNFGVYDGAFGAQGGFRGTVDNVQARSSNIMFVDYSAFDGANTTFDSTHLVVQSRLTCSNSQLSSSTIVLGNPFNPPQDVYLTNVRVEASQIYDDVTGGRQYANTTFTANRSSISNTTGTISAYRSVIGGFLGIQETAANFYIWQLSNFGETRFNYVYCPNVEIWSVSVSGALNVSTVSGPSNIIYLSGCSVLSGSEIYYAFADGFDTYLYDCHTRAGGRLQIQDLVDSVELTNVDVANGRVRTSGGTSLNVVKARGGTLDLQAFSHQNVYHNVNASDTLTAPNTNTSRDDFNNSLI